MTIWSMLDFGDKPETPPPVPLTAATLPADEPPRRKGGWPKGRPRKVAK